MITIKRTLGVSVAAGVFAVGFIVGGATERAAQAQLGDLGKQVLEKAGEQGGVLGAAGKLGTTIQDMEKNVAELQKSLDTLREVKAALGG